MKMGIPERDGLQSAKHQLYQNAFIGNIKQIDIDNPDRDTLKKLIFYGVKMINTKPERQTTTYDEAILAFQFAMLVQGMMGFLTPAEFVSMFPIAKEYDGNKYGTKDYFYTMNYIKSLPDKPIGDIKSVMKFLWEYCNWEINIFTVNVFSCMDDLREMEGHPSFMEEWANMNGIKTYTMYTDSGGKKFLLDRETGKSFKVRKKTPRYLRLIKKEGTA